MRTFEDPIEDLHEDLEKIFEFKFLLRFSRIFHFLAKIFKGL